MEHKSKPFDTLPSVNRGLPLRPPAASPVIINNVEHLVTTDMTEGRSYRNKTQVVKELISILLNINGRTPPTPVSLFDSTIHILSSPL